MAGIPARIVTDRFSVCDGHAGDDRASAALTLHIRAGRGGSGCGGGEPTPYGYTVSLLLFIVPILAIGSGSCARGVKISQRAFWRTIAVLFRWARLWTFSLRDRFSSSEFPARRCASPLRRWARRAGGGVRFLLHRIRGCSADVHLAWTSIGWRRIAFRRMPKRERSSTGCCAFIFSRWFGLCC